MRWAVRSLPVALIAVLLLPALWLPSRLLLPGSTWLQLEDGGTGRNIYSAVLRDGDQAVLTWTNSIFGQVVTEVFVAADGRLVLTSITFSEPGDPYQMPVTPADVDDLYHTGGPFSAQGLHKPFSRVVYRIGEIGHPRLQVGASTVDFKKEVGFGGRVVLATRPASWYDRLRVAR